MAGGLGDRHSRAASRARFVLYYLLTVELDLGQSVVGRLVGRDRKSIIHGCAAVEDARDRREFDRAIEVIARWCREAPSAEPQASPTAAVETVGHSPPHR